MSEMPEDLKRSSRDRVELGRRLAEWLSRKLDGQVTVADIEVPEGSGMSSETLLFTARHGDDRHALVARIAPDDDDVPVFPTYDLDLQFRVMRLVGEHSTVPVPNARWLETDRSVLGSAFFVMDRVEGRAAADIPPYVFEGWVFDGTPHQQRHLQDEAVGILARVHSIDVTVDDTSFLEVEAPGDTPLRRQVNWWRNYYDWTRGDRVHPVLEEGIGWLEDNWPRETPSVITWGDSRIGNVLWSGFDPAAVVDWEMACLGPRELDLGWMIFLHTFFQDLAVQFGLPGLPDFMQRDDVAATYTALSGTEPVDLAWYEAFAAWRHGIIMARIHARNVRFGTAEWTDDVDAPILHRDRLAQLTS